MIALIETVAYLVLWGCILCVIFVAALKLIDMVFKLLAFSYIKILVDRSANYDTFNSCWDDVKKKL